MEIVIQTKTVRERVHYKKSARNCNVVVSFKYHDEQLGASVVGSIIGK